MMQSVRRRLDCFEFDLSMEHIADSHSSAMALESVSYRRGQLEAGASQPRRATLEVIRVRGCRIH